MQAEQKFQPPVQSDCFIVTSCWVWSIYTHLWLCSDSAMDMIFTSVSGKIINWLLPALFCSLVGIIHCRVVCVCACF